MMIMQTTRTEMENAIWVGIRHSPKRRRIQLQLQMNSPMAAAAAQQFSYFMIGSASFDPQLAGLRFSRHIKSSFYTDFCSRRRRVIGFQRPRCTVICSASDKPTSSEISSSAKIRSEVLSPFRSVRMFFYVAFIASGGLGGFIAATQLIAALSNPSRANDVPDIAKGLAIDLGAVALFAFLYYRENTAKNAQLAKLSREESLSALRIRVDQKRVLPVSAFRGAARLVILAGPESFILESFRSSEPFTESLLERAVLVVPFVTDGNLPSFEFDESEELKEVTAKRRRLWQLSPVYANEWSSWLDDQKKLAGVSPESPVYLSLRMDGRVRGSGVGYPPWNAFVAQLPPLKGLWSGLLDGMDGRVL